MTYWTPYRPNAAQPWNLPRVVHLHRRVAFGATIGEQQRDLESDPQQSVTRLLEGTTRIQTPASFDDLSVVIGNAAADSPNPDRLKAWWLYRCLFSPDPLQERLTLMWHNHFATSNLKVANLQQMKTQNETLRQHSRSNFGDLLHAMIRDPALLFWLDASANRKGHPNENLSRELMELFTLGVGNYSEDDVKHVARSFTGWTIRNGVFKERLGLHDEGDKVVLNQTGQWTGHDVVELLLKQKATADRLAWRLTSEFFGESVVSDAAREDISKSLQADNLNIGAVLEKLLRSELFFSDANLNSRVCDPVSFLIGPLRTLDCLSPPPSTLMLAEWLRRMGQDLFYPPNVGGWNGGRAWLSTRTIIARTNYAASLASGQLHSPVKEPDFKALCNEVPDADSLAAVLGIAQNQSHKRKPSADTFVTLMTQPNAHLH